MINFLKIYDIFWAYKTKNIDIYRFWEKNKTDLLKRFGLTDNDAPEIAWFHNSRWYYRRSGLYGMLHFCFSCQAAAPVFAMKSLIVFSKTKALLDRGSLAPALTATFPDYIHIKPENYAIFIFLHEFMHTVQYQKKHFPNPYNLDVYCSMSNGKWYYGTRKAAQSCTDNFGYVLLPQEWDANIFAIQLVLELQDKGII